MQQEMTFAQALGEARQIIVQQSNRIKSDLEKVVALQNTIAAQSTTISQSERVIREQSTKLSEMEEQVRLLSAKLEEMTTACKQSDAIIDRQGQRLTAATALSAELERKGAENSHRVAELAAQLEDLQNQLPTQEDEDALVALASLLQTKKVSVPSLNTTTTAKSGLRIAPPGAVAA
jgi:predicted RNase H-like nuclease (RuvC/YqgF family)